jgi:MFS transporter, ACS family, tartrate transporter
MSIATPSALDRARSKAYLRLLPLLFLCYVIAYVDRANVALAKLKMTHDLPGFDNAVIGFGAGVFFIGYFLLEIPGTLLVEKWSARKWISRIMITWGLMAALTAAVKTPLHFYIVRFLLGLAEAGFFPGVIVYLTHWFPSRDRARALAWFFIATPIAQIVSPKPTNWLLAIGTEGRPAILGLVGWQWVYIAWGVPAVILSVIVLIFLTDQPRQAHWLTPEEREALEGELSREKALHHGGKHLGAVQARSDVVKVVALAAAYFFVVTGNYGVEFFLPSILERWGVVARRVPKGSGLWYTGASSPTPHLSPDPPHPRCPLAQLRPNPSTASATGHSTTTPWSAGGRSPSGSNRTRSRRGGIRGRLNRGHNSSTATWRSNAC